MSDATEHRKLAAIMFTDMVGYTALTQRSEKLALELLEEHRCLLRELFLKFNGREIETAGDGFLVEFASALEAARCAIEIQRTLATRNISVPLDRQIQLRIGIHVGDIIHKDGHLLGDGVNIAARLQPLAEPGGICISVDVAHQIQHNLEAAVVTMGQKELKNVRMPVEVCRIVLPWERRGAPTLASHTAAHLHEISSRTRFNRMRAPSLLTLLGLLVLGLAGGWAYRKFGQSPTSTPVSPLNAPAVVAPAEKAKSIAVLPFKNMSPDKDNEYFSDGLTEQITTALSQIKDLDVKGRTSAFVFKERQENLRDIGRQLNAAFLLEGSVQKAGSQLRINVQLIQASADKHLWATHYDREFTNIFAIQSELAQNVVDVLKGQLLPEEKQRLSRHGTEDPEALDLYLRGRFFWNKRLSGGLRQATNFFAQAIARDARYAQAYVGLADCYGVMADWRILRPKDASPTAIALTQKAIALDDNLAEAHASLAKLKGTYEWDWAAAEKEFKRAIELDPSYPPAHYWYATTFLTPSGRSDEAVVEVRRALESDPLSVVAIWHAGLVYYWLRRYDQAIEQFLRAHELDSSAVNPLNWLAKAYDHSGQPKEAFATLQKLSIPSQLLPERMAALKEAYERDGIKGYHQTQLDWLTGVPDADRNEYGITRLSARLGHTERALQGLQHAYEERFPTLYYIKMDPDFESLRTDARFLELLRKIGLEK
ncbi:MAG: hypothetical protein HYY23_05460 [Verrucomicrobia bacterium]|nr:hypothetical protein [Verrucomicrobiota bacterium]